MTDRSLLLVHAHPDDETIGTGATMAMYAAGGVNVTLVTCTMGEEGEVLVPALAGIAADKADQLGGWRIHELEEACKVLGVRDHRFLGGGRGFRDTRMMDTPANQNPRCFWQADLEVATAQLVEIIREVRPQVVVTYDDFGGYGHPDHIQAHRVAMRAAELAADPNFGTEPAHEVSKIYWNTVPRSVVQAGLDSLRAAGDSTGFTAVESVDDLPFVADDDTVTAVVHAEEYAERKAAAMRAHATQITVDGPFF